MERCGACRARLGDATVCPRCGCDFGLSVKAERQAHTLLGRALCTWADGRVDAARALVDESLSLRRTRLTLAAARMMKAAGPWPAASEFADTMPTQAPVAKAFFNPCDGSKQ